MRVRKRNSGRRAIPLDENLREANLAEILFEFHRVGSYVRIVAIDPKTGVEVTTVGPQRYGVEMLKRAAAQKLAYVIKNKKGMAAPNRRGILA